MAFMRFNLDGKSSIRIGGKTRLEGRRGGRGRTVEGKKGNVHIGRREEGEKGTGEGKERAMESQIQFLNFLLLYRHHESAAVGKSDRRRRGEAQERVWRENFQIDSVHILSDCLSIRPPICLMLRTADGPVI